MPTITWLRSLTFSTSPPPRHDSAGSPRATCRRDRRSRRPGAGARLRSGRRCCPRSVARLPRSVHEHPSARPSRPRRPPCPNPYQSASAPPSSVVAIRPWYDPRRRRRGPRPPLALRRDVLARRARADGDLADPPVGRGSRSGPEGYELDLASHGAGDGSGFPVGRASPFSKALQRCVMFGLAHPIPAGSPSVAAYRRSPIATCAACPTKCRPPSSPGRRPWCHLDDLTRGAPPGDRDGRRRRRPHGDRAPARGASGWPTPSRRTPPTTSCASSAVIPAAMRTLRRGV